MTRDEILEMVPGRELDNLITEFVMGLTEKDFDDIYTNEWRYKREDGHWFPSRHYSTDIYAAWEVVEKFDNMTFRRMREADGHIRHFAYIWLNHGINAPLIMCKADTMAEAICKAALLSKEVPK